MDIVVWSKESCSYCVKAKALLEHKGLVYEERKIGDGWDVSDLLAEVPSAKSVPQIFINEELVGGFTQLAEYLERQL